MTKQQAEQTTGRKISEKDKVLRMANNRADRLRIRAAWMYFVEQKTQNEIADILGVGRVTVVRMLAEARARNEVKLSIESAIDELVMLERELETGFGLPKAVVAPLSQPGEDPIPAISAATGDYLSETMASGMTVGVGWGRTLFASLAYIRMQNLSDFRVISLLGGVSQVRHFNPAEFAWRFAEAFQGEGFLIPAPALVDSIDTKTALIERCGIQAIFDLADNLDAVVLSAGAVTSAATAYRGGFLGAAEQAELAAEGAVGDVLFRFFDRSGTPLDTPLNKRVMSVEIEQLRRAPIRILCSGGADKVDALLGAVKLLQPTVLITDEETATGMLRAAG